ncbi:MAG: AMP-binding protein [Geobacteraceae bacterium]|nr:AMP-binding protein [Geobacteraceae bacterium]
MRGAFSMLDTFLTRTRFESYEDFVENFSINVPESFNFAYDVADEIALRDPDRTAIIWCDDRGAEAVFTFGQVKRYSDKAASFFRSAGIGKGDPVMLVLKRRYEFWFCLLALHKLGAIAIPATHLLTSKDIVYRCNAADIKMVVAVNDPDVILHVEESLEKSPTLRCKAVLGADRDGWLNFSAELEKAPEDFRAPAGEDRVSNDDISLLYFTSGTTGMPKMVRHDFVYPLGHILTAKYWQCVREGGIHLTIADTGWAKAVWGKIYGQWLSGGAVFVYDYEKFTPRNLLEVIARYGVTTFCAPPTIYRFLIKEDFSGLDLSRLQYCVIAGEPLNPEVYNQFLKKTGIRLMEGYGQTECTLAIATYPWMAPKPGSMGRPSPMYDMDIVNDELRPCEVGEEGQIIIRTAVRKPVGMFSGYHRDAEMTRRVWHDGIYYTGDMAWRDEDGYYWFVGRSDDVIKSSGYRIGPFEVESALLEHPAVMECAITAVPDEIRGQIVKATVVLTKEYAPSNDLVEELQEHVRKLTAPYKYPRIIEFLPELPKTISGKIRRVEIREKDKSDGGGPGL